MDNLSDEQKRYANGLARYLMECIMKYQDVIKPPQDISANELIVSIIGALEETSRALIQSYKNRIEELNNQQQSKL